jgi:hypothetical protein
MFTYLNDIFRLILVHLKSSVNWLILLLFRWHIIIIIIIIICRHFFYLHRCLLRYFALKWLIRRSILPISIKGNVSCKMHYVCLKQQYNKNGQYFSHTLTTKHRNTDLWHNPAHNFWRHSIPTRVSIYRNSVNIIFWTHYILMAGRN